MATLQSARSDLLAVVVTPPPTSPDCAGCRPVPTTLEDTNVLYLAYHDDHDLPDDVVGPWREVFRLKPDLLFIDSDQSRSVVYHALKDHLPAGSALLVSTATEVPKFKGMAPGALAWARSRTLRRTDS